MSVEGFLTCFIIGRLDILLCSLYDKSRMTGDCHVRFCERDGVRFPVPTQHCHIVIPSEHRVVLLYYNNPI
jgi:hypothetical protein